MKNSHLLPLLLLSVLISCSKKEEAPTLDNLLRFQNQNYSFLDTREGKDNEFIISEYKQRNSRLYFVSPTKEMNMFLFSEKYKKTFEDLGLEVYSLGDEHIGYDEHSIVYIVPAKSGKSLVVFLAVKTAEYPTKHEQATAFLNELKNLTPVANPQKEK